MNDIAHDVTDVGVEGNVYEVGFHIISSVAEEQVPAIYTDIKNLIEGIGGTVITEEFPKMQPLAYTIKKVIGGGYQKFDKAYFGWTKFEAPSESALSLKEKMDKNENILRYLIVKTVKENTLYGAKLAQELKLATDKIKVKDDKSEEEVEAKKEAPSEEADKSSDDLVTTE